MAVRYTPDVFMGPRMGYPSGHQAHWATNTSSSPSPLSLPSVCSPHCSSSVSARELEPRGQLTEASPPPVSPSREGGYDTRTIQELLGHKDVRTTMIYAHSLNRGGLGVESPLDRV